MAGVRVTQPAAGTGQGSASTTPEIDTADIDYSAGAGTDVRERQRVLLAGSGVGTDVAVLNGTPTGTEYGLIVRQAAPVGSVIQSNGGVQAFVKSIKPADTDAGLVVRHAGPADTHAQLYDSNGNAYTPANPVPTKAWLYDGAGNLYSTTNRLPVDIAGATVQATFQSQVSVGNSTQTPLAANATFTGAWEDVRDFAAITGALSSDQPSAINGVIAEFALDSAGTLVVTQQTTTYPGGGMGAYFAFPPEARYVRIRYTNGPTAQTFLRSQVAYEFTAPTEPLQALGGQVTDANIGSVERACLTGRLTTGQWKSLLSSPEGYLSTRIENSPVVTTTDSQVTGTLTAAQPAQTGAQTYYDVSTTGATAVRISVPDGHQSSQIFLSGTFSAGSQVFFEGSATGADNSWFALNHRRNGDATTNEQATIIDGNPFGGPSPGGAGLSNWRGSPGGVRFLRVRCGAFAAGDSISVVITTSHGGGPVFQQGPPPMASDAYTSPTTLAAVGDTVAVRTVGASGWSAYMTGQFTGTVYFEATSDGVNWTKINGAVQGVGSLQTQLTGTGAASQSLAVRGSAGGLQSVRLRAGSDFVGSFTGAMRAGQGTAGVFVVAPVPIAGLSSGAQTARVAVGATAAQLDVAPLGARTSIEVRAMSTNTGAVYIGFSSAVTAGSGRELVAGEAWTLDLTSVTQLWAISAVAAQSVQITEVG